MLYLSGHNDPDTKDVEEGGRPLDFGIGFASEISCG
jgi:hypothetical protein